MLIPSELDNQQSRFYFFLILHSVLIGLFPFFIPVFLWRMDFSLAGISFYIGISGLSFCLALSVWDRLRQHAGLYSLILISLALELLLVLCAYFSSYDWFILCFGLLSGCYSCSYWMTQRAMFIETITIENSGNSFGNLQIIVLIALKLAMLCGGILLERAGIVSVFTLSASLVLLAIVSTSLLKLDYQAFSTPEVSSPVSQKQWRTFGDEYNSRPVFLVDGIFLFLESHFWLLSLFFIANENFTQLSLLVIALGLVFSVFFWITKKTIDRVSGNLIYQITVIGYALSWLLRAFIADMSNTLFVISLVLITFLTSMFRLSFNKRFFDHALQGDPHYYLVCKSYLSQSILAMVFILAGVLMLLGNFKPSSSLTMMYCLAIPLTACYWMYRAKSSRVTA